MGTLKIGDKLTYTNDNGVVFPGKTVTGFCDWDWGHFKNDGYVFIDTDCYWMPVSPANLKIEKY